MKSLANELATLLRPAITSVLTNVIENSSVQKISMKELGKYPEEGHPDSRPIIVRFVRRQTVHTRKILDICQNIKKIKVVKRSLFLLQKILQH
jgi:hypothetical protein